MAPPLRGWLKANALSPDAEFAAFLTAQHVPDPAVFAETAKLTGRSLAATLVVTDADRQAGNEPKLVDGFVTELANTALPPAGPTQM